MNIFRPYLFIILFFGCSTQPSELDLLNKEYPQGNYGNSIQKGIPNRIHEVLKNPDKYLNKNVSPSVSNHLDDDPTTAHKFCRLRKIELNFYMKSIQLECD